jgi:hypothetical protein
MLVQALRGVLVYTSCVWVLRVRACRWCNALLMYVLQAAVSRGTQLL